ncbi:MAG: hypothetical protein LUC24_00595 [Bacteroidales bacterium]|nr:hypothetical protein [Bacteroidales bacterium]
MRRIAFGLLLLLTASFWVNARPECSAAGKSGQSQETQSARKDRKRKDEEPQDAKQSMPRSLTANPAIATGTLANGMTYYIVTNATEVGLAQFALVRRIGYVADRDSTLRRARSLIADLPRFKGRSVKDFVAGGGGNAVPGSKSLGLRGISLWDDALICNFGSLPVGARSSLMDSTLLMIFDIVEDFQNGGAPAGYSTSDNAVIISGDVDKSAVLTKLQNLSLMVESVSVPGGEPRQYSWQPREEIRCTVEKSRTGRAATLSFTYASPRTPDKYLGTTLSDVSYYYGELLSIVLKRRIVTDMRAADIPLAHLTTKYRPSSLQPGDESYSITVTVAPEDVSATCRTVASVIADLDTYGVSVQEFGQARREYLTSLYISSQKSVVSNDMYVDKCLSAFLYGTTPATDYERWSFLGKGTADESGTKYFNGFVAKLLNGTDNLDISLRIGDTTNVSAGEIAGIFADEVVRDRSDAPRKSYNVNYSDTLSLEKHAEKVKVTQTRTDAVSGGGTKWVFSNGMTVVYKRMDTQGLFYYNLLIRGGFSSVKGLSKGEGAFLSDMLGIYDVGGVKGENFHSVMLSNGITVSADVNVSDMNIYGVAMRPSLNLLMKVLTSYAGAGSVDRKRFDYYRRHELLRLESDKGSPESRRAKIDSLFSPTYRYYPDKMISGLHERVADIADRYFNDQFSRVNDGVFVIVGDMNEDLMRKLLTKYMGAFTTNDDSSQRARIEYSPVSGQTTLIEDGEKMSVDVALSVPFAFTAANFMVTKIAGLALQDRLNRNLAGKGAVATVSTDFFSYPQERVVFVATVENVDLNAVPAGEEHLDHPELLFEVGETLKDFKVAADDLKLYKTVLKNQFKARQNDPWYWIHMVRTRVSDVKDLNSKYSDKIDAVTADQVSALISRLDTGSKVEYILR